MPGMYDSLLTLPGYHRGLAAARRLAADDLRAAGQDAAADRNERLANEHLARVAELEGGKR